MNWSHWRSIPWIDSRVAFVAAIPAGGALLDLGSSDGETLCHMSELRPDLRFYSVDIAGPPARAPAETSFAKADLESQSLPWPDRSIDAITCMHLVEHLRTMANLWREVARVLKPGGRIYVETPGPKSLTTPRARGAMLGKVTLNFFDDPTHIHPVPVGALAQAARDAGLVVERSGVARNWLFAAAYPFLSFLPATRRKFVAKLHWLGWSVYLVAQKPATW